jgi:hypothetical protein
MKYDKQNSKKDEPFTEYHEDYELPTDEEIDEKFHEECIEEIVKYPKLYIVDKCREDRTENGRIALYSGMGIS